jgi:hypothetical protein
MDREESSIANWMQDRSKAETAFQALVVTLQEDLKVYAICEIAFYDRVAYVRHTKSRIIFATVNLIDDTVGLLPRKKDKKDIAPYHSIFKWLTDPAALSDIRFTFDFRSKDLLQKWKIKNVPDLFPVKMMS